MVSIGSLLLLVFNSCPVFFFFCNITIGVCKNSSDDDVTSRTFQNLRHIIMEIDRMLIIKWACYGFSHFQFSSVGVSVSARTSFAIMSILHAWPWSTEYSHDVRSQLGVSMVWASEIAIFILALRREPECFGLKNTIWDTYIPLRFKKLSMLDCVDLYSDVISHCVGK